MKASRIILALAVIVTSCIRDVEPTRITLNETVISINEGDSFQLTAVVAPEGAPQNVRWSSMDESIATVEDGLVLGVNGGRTFILATLGSLQEGCEVLVVAPVTSLTLDAHELQVNLGSTYQFTPAFTPANAFEQRIIWSSTNSNVAYVTNGVLVAKGLGRATITAASYENPEITDQCEVEVIESVTGLSITPAETTLSVGETVALTAVVTPENATYTAVTWTSSDPAIASVDKDGVVTAKAGGTVTITAVSVQGGVSATATIHVNTPVTGVSLNKTELKLFTGEYATLVATVAPVDAFNQNVTWASDNEAVATVSASGMVSAIAVGTANITVTTEDGGFKATCAVSVLQGAAKVTGVTLNITSATIAAGKTVTLLANVLPADAGDKSVVWSTDDASIATVDANGVVTGVKAGQTTVWVTTNEGGFKASCAIKVAAMGSGDLDGYDGSDYIWKN